jgi:hypothetical protein
MEPEVSLQCPQELATVPDNDVDVSSAHTPILSRQGYLLDSAQIIFSCAYKLNNEELWEGAQKS